MSRTLIAPRMVHRRLTRQEFDVVHVQADARMALFLQRKLTIPVILTLHGIAELDVLGPKGEIPYLRFAVMWLKEARSRRKVDFVVSISPNVRRYVGARNKLLWEVPNAIDSRFLTSEACCTGDVRRILFVGRVTHLKNVHGLIRGFNEVAAVDSGVQLGIMGPFENKEYERELVGLVRDLHLEARVEFIDAAGVEEVILQMRRSKVLVLPSYQENSPMVLCEAAALGLSVVASRVGGVPDLLREYPLATLVEPTDIGALASAILASLRSPAPDEVARSYALRHAPWRVAEQTLEAYAQAMSMEQRQ